jgi:hypothetical protein
MLSAPLEGLENNDRKYQETVPFRHAPAGSVVAAAGLALAGFSGCVPG